MSLKSVLPLASTPLLFSAKEMIKQYNTKSDSDQAYKKTTPIIKQLISQGLNLTNPELKGAVEILESLAPTGARKINFKKRYLNSTATLRELPDDPDKLGYGYWW